MAVGRCGSTGYSPENKHHRIAAGIVTSFIVAKRTIETVDTDKGKTVGTDLLGDGVVSI